MADAPASPPRALIRSERRWSWAWLLPILALIAAGALAWSAVRERGTIVTVQLPDGHGLQAGDPVRHRGIDVGEVKDVHLADDLNDVIVHVRLRPDAEALAAAGARFWVVRPRLGFAGVEGLETLVGPRYMALLPGPPGGAPQRAFIGLAQPPMIESVEPGDLEIVLEADARGSLRPGAPLTFRGVHVGVVVSVGLASDGSIIEARIHIPKQHRPLVRAETKFWDAGGVNVDLGLSGMSVEMDSLAELFAGGVAMATPAL